MQKFCRCPSIDYAGNSYDSILVIVDYFSKYKIIVPINSTIDSPTLAKIFLDKVFCRFGLPSKIVSDRGSIFISQFTKDLYSLLGITGSPSTAFHPQTDGQTERMNQEIALYLRIFCNFHQNDWCQKLSICKFVWNNRIHSATKQTPFYLMFGFHPSTGLNPTVSNVRSHGAELFKQELDKIREEAKSAMLYASQQAKHFYDRKRNPSIPYNPGDLVYVDSTFINSTRPSKKLSDKRYGPFKIIEKIGKSSYKLDIPRSWLSSVHNVFPEVILTPHQPPSFPSQSLPPPPPPVIVDNDLEWEVDSLLDVRKRGRGLQYLVHWKGFPHEQDSWEPKSNLTNVPDLLQEFYTKKPNALRSFHPSLFDYFQSSYAQDPSISQISRTKS